MPMTFAEHVALQDALSRHLAEVAKLFGPGARLTLVVRNPDTPGDAGLVIGDDDLELAVEEIRRRQRAAGVQAPAPGVGDDTRKMAAENARLRKACETVLRWCEVNDRRGSILYKEVSAAVGRK